MELLRPRALERARASSDSIVRSNAVRAFQRSTDTNVARRLWAHAGDDDEALRLAVARDLAVRRDAEAIELLERMTHDKSLAVRTEAIRALALRRPPR